MENWMWNSLQKNSGEYKVICRIFNQMIRLKMRMNSETICGKDFCCIVLKTPIPP